LRTSLSQAPSAPAQYIYTAWSQYSLASRIASRFGIFIYTPWSQKNYRALNFIQIWIFELHRDLGVLIPKEFLVVSNFIQIF
jgi:hypothetical protein